ncbi:hypothetical protein [Roseimicrobium sp. ORNL1]|uniref:hypothetical protein n=1 Tax=Roseimicrobium sp. ORNL1 TaxID=2711231 RepID=UPI0013E1BCF5|nr:hypothetical protein [Roseimicrobium sp. ORNL1]QIF02821.1 hypothetical protein G5S37_15255 [Roseimicrobium sp. ORNL1]
MKTKLLTLGVALTAMLGAASCTTVEVPPPTVVTTTTTTQETVRSIQTHTPGMGASTTTTRTYRTY